MAKHMTDAERKAAAAKAQVDNASQGGAQGVTNTVTTNMFLQGVGGVGGDATLAATFGLDPTMMMAPINIRRSPITSPNSGSLSDGLSSIGTATGFGSYDTITVGDFLKQVSAYSSDRIKELQQKLQGAGLLRTPNGYSAINGQLDDYTRSAIAALLKTGATMQGGGPGTPGPTIDDLLESGGLSQTGQSVFEIAQGQFSAAPNYEIHLTNAEDIAAVARKVGQAVLGRKANDAEIAKITGALHGQETGAQQTAINAQEATRRKNFDAATQANQAAATTLATAQTGAQTGAGAPADLGQVMNAIKSVESGNYAEKPNRAQASGAYQFTPGTWKDWAGAELAAKYPEAYLAPPEVQDQVAAKALSGYYDRYHDWGLVAIAWNGGVGTADKVAKDPTVGDRISDGNITVNEYRRRFLTSMGKGTPGPGGSTILSEPNVYVPAATTTINDPASAATVAEDQLRKADPVEAGAHDVANTFQSFLQVIGAAK